MAVFAKGRGVAFLGLFVTLMLVTACGTRGAEDPTETSASEPGADVAGQGVPGVLEGSETVTEGLAGGVLEDPFAATEGTAAQPDLGTGTVPAPPGTAGAPGTGVVDPALGSGPGTDIAVSPAGGPDAGAGGTAEKLDIPLLVLGALTAAVGTIALARRRQVQGPGSE